MGQGLVGIGQDASGPGPELCTTLARAQHQDLVDAFFGSYWGVSLPSAWEFEVRGECQNLRILVSYTLKDLTAVSLAANLKRYQHVVDTEPSIFSTANSGSAVVKFQNC
jgi:hypothetical protein